MTKEQRARGKKYLRIYDALSITFWRISEAETEAEDGIENVALRNAIDSITDARNFLKEAIKRCGESE